MIIRIYQCDGYTTHSVLHASCIAELTLSENEFEQQRETLLREYNGDFFTLDEGMNNDAQLLC